MSMYASSILIVALFASSNTSARVATIDLQQLTKQSTLVVVGTVTSIWTDELRLAEVQIESTLKGQASGQLTVVAQPTWRCDISDAKPGERLLLFLNPIKAGTMAGGKIGVQKRLPHDAFLIAHSGRGRIELLGTGSDSRIEFKPSSYMEATEYTVNLRLPKDFPYVHERGITVLPTTILLARVEMYCRQIAHFQKG